MRKGETLEEAARVEWWEPSRAGGACEGNEDSEGGWKKPPDGLLSSDISP